MVIVRATVRLLERNLRRFVGRVVGNRMKRG